MTVVKPAQTIEQLHVRGKRRLYFVCALYLVMGAIFSSSNLDIDEFNFIREPYELLGGDYTVGYLQEGKYADATTTLMKAYYFYWKYRPLFSPIISADDQALFSEQERQFGYTKPEPVSNEAQDAQGSYEQRLIVPEPDRFYSHGAGKPLLAPILSIPQLALIQAIAPENLLHYQYNYNYHPVFILTRLVQLLAGLITILLVHRILARECDEERALLGAAIVALFPLCIKYFPNLHHDSVLVPFLVFSMYCFYKEDYKRAGISFGLALAAKNAAIFLVPVFLAHIAWNAWTSRGENRDTIRQQARGFAIVMALGFLSLVPFANPVAYASEILTPITHRVTDTRGEDVEQFTLSERLSEEQSASTRSVVRPEIRLTDWLLRLEKNDFFLLMIGFFIFWSQPRNPLARMAFIFLLLAAPYGLVFGYDMNYRSLQFVPFFAILCASLAPKKLLLGFAVVLGLLAGLYCVDPITTDRLHILVDDRTFWEALF